MNEGPDARTYGIIPLSSEGEKNLKNLPLPLVTELALILIQGKITYDFLFIIMIQPDNSMKDQILSNYNQLKGKHGIVTSIT